MSQCTCYVPANYYSKKVTSNRDGTLHPRTVWSAHSLYLQSHAFPSELSWQVLSEGSYTTSVCALIDFWT